MSAYKHLAMAWRKPNQSYVKRLMRDMAVKWRREGSVQRVDRPTRLDRARRLGYKAKQGFIVVRVRVRSGGARKVRPSSGRRPKAMGVVKYTRAISLMRVAEERASRKYPNLEVLNSYHVWSDAKHHWFEIILVDRHGFA